MNTRHEEKVKELQKQIQAQKEPTALNLDNNPSNTTRSKSYKDHCTPLDLSSLNHIIKIDPEKRIAIVEPRVTMEKLVKATRDYGLMPPVVPEFKGITVGGAIMGGAAESASDRWGSFNDTCIAYELICGDGSLLRATPTENSDIFYGITGSYGSLGAIVLIEIQLVPVKEFVHLKYHTFSKPLDAIKHLRQLIHQPDSPDFLDGIIFSNHKAVIIEGTLEHTPQNLPVFSTKPLGAEWYFQHVKSLTCKDARKEEAMPYQDYLFRYDQGAFWMGSYLLRLPLLHRFIFNGIYQNASTNTFTEAQIKDLCKVHSPNLLSRILLSPIMTCKRLWKLLHLAEKWVQNNVIIQDLCIPENNAGSFLEEILKDPGTFPIWLCPVKGTREPQIFSPHLLPPNSSDTHFINFGIYGLPAYYGSISKITKMLEDKTIAHNGRKVMYSRNYYSEKEFWKIYSRDAYESLRAHTHSKGTWHTITDKLLSE